MDKCVFPRCRQFSTLVYVGRDICEEHWEQLCEENSGTENNLLSKIGLVRDIAGSVVPITRNKKD